jgi:hypothetical protein
MLEQSYNQKVGEYVFTMRFNYVLIGQLRQFAICLHRTRSLRLHFKRAGNVAELGACGKGKFEIRKSKWGWERLTANFASSELCEQQDAEQAARSMATGNFAN